MIVSLLTIGLLLIPSSNAFFRMPCKKPVLNARTDSIVSPGHPSSHMHTTMGSSAIGLSTTFEDLRTSNCTTCMVNDDRSAYWTPGLYYQFQNGSFQNVDHGGMLVYYLQRGGDNETIQPFPDGLVMLTGDPYARTCGDSNEAKAISWLCLDHTKPYQPQSQQLNNTVCPDGLRGQVFFPGCWDGMNLDSPDHKSHMAYPDGMDNGHCPPSHPVHLVSIFFEVWFDVDKFNKLNDGGRFVLANGDPTGCGMHGDFKNGWDHDVLSRAVKNCTNLSGMIQDCEVFSLENRFVPDDVMNSCAAQNPLPNEDVGDFGPIPYLPGCVAVTEGPAPATAADLDPKCVAANGGSLLSTNTSSNMLPASSSLAEPMPSSVMMPANGDGSVPTNSPAEPMPSSVMMPANGDGSVPTNSPAEPMPSSVMMPANGYGSVPTNSPASPLPKTMPASDDDCLEDDSPANPPPSSTPPVPTSSMPSPPNPSPVPSNSMMSSPPPSSLNPMPTNTPADVNPPNGGNNDAVNANGNSKPSLSLSPSPSSSPAPGGPASLDPGAVKPNTSTVHPSGMPHNGTHSSKGPAPSGNHTQQGNGSDGGDDYCSGGSNRAANKTTYRRHHARRAKHGSNMRF